MLKTNIWLGARAVIQKNRIVIPVTRPYTTLAVIKLSTLHFLPLLMTYEYVSLVAVRVFPEHRFVN